LIILFFSSGVGTKTFVLSELEPCIAPPTPPRSDSLLDLDEPPFLDRNGLDDLVSRP